MNKSSHDFTRLSVEEKRRLLAQIANKRASEPQSFPLSFNQERLWFLEQLSPGNTFFNIPVALQLPFPVNPAVLEACLQTIVERHESLRTTFAVVDGSPVQVVAASLPLTLDVTDLRTLPAEQQLAEAHR